MNFNKRFLKIFFCFSLISSLTLFSFSSMAKENIKNGYGKDKLFYKDGNVCSWWADDGNDWFFFKDGKKLTGEGIDKNGKHLFKNGKYLTGYFDKLFYKDGNVCSWWADDGNDWFFFKDGKKFTGISSDASGKHYFKDGKYFNGLLDNKLYKNGLVSNGKTYVNNIFYDENLKLANWWYDDGDDWFFFKDGKKLTGEGIDKNGKHLFKNGKYLTGYFDKLFYKDGNVCSWWADDGNDWFFFKDGKKFTGISSDASGKHYFKDGKYFNGFLDNKLYKNGLLSNGKTYVNGIFYDENLKPANWWYDDGDDWFYFKDGKKFTGTSSDASGKHYFKDGKYFNGFLDNKLYKNGLLSNGKTYVNGIFYDENLKPANWWYDDGDDWFYFKDGKKFTGTSSDASGKHYFKDGKYFNDQWDIVDNILYIKNSSDAINVNGDCIVVSLYDQKLWLIRNNEILLETGIISGKLSTPTPTGHYSIQNMQSPSTLIGTTYRVHVDYWMPFIGNSYGIHDASWANPDDFSKPSTHYYWGSHGCININPDIMGYIYSNTYIGMDVVIY